MTLSQFIIDRMSWLEKRGEDCAVGSERERLRILVSYQREPLVGSFRSIDLLLFDGGCHVELFGYVPYLDEAHGNIFPVIDLCMVHSTAHSGVLYSSLVEN